MRHRCGAGLAVGLLLAAAPVGAQERLTVERIFGTAELTPRTYEARWQPGGEGVATLELDATSGDSDVWVEGISTGKRTRLVEGASLVLADSAAPLEVEEITWSADGRRLLVFANAQRVWRRYTKGVYYVYDLATRRLTPVSRAPGWQMFAKFSPDGRMVGFVRDHDLFVTDLTTGVERRLTTDGSETIINGTTDWVYEEELDLADAWRWSPDGKRIAYWRFDQSPVRPFTLVDELGQYSVPVQIRYPKAGTANSTVRVGVLDLASGATTWLDVGGDPDVYIARMEWAASPRELIVQRLNRLQNRLDVLLADATTGRTRVLFTESDSAWVDVDDDLRFVGDGARFLWTSPRDGFNHVYLYNRDGTLARQVTRGDWEVSALYGADDRGWLYFAGTAEGPRERHVYRVRFDGSRMERLTREPGTHAADFSPDMRWFVGTHSRVGSPPVYRLYESGGRALRVLEDNAAVRDALARQRLGSVEFLQVPAADGVTRLNAWMMKPPDFDASRKYPVLMYVYGGPGSQTVTDAWGGKRWLWHQLLAQNGYVVVSVDNRGTGGRGEAFRQAVYLNLGRLESDDQIAAARHFASLPYVDPQRIGIWGWSYGGFMTALTAARGGELFRAGISVAPVTHWRLYDTIYTERYMRTPQLNPTGYRENSPMEHARGLTAHLLLIHGTGDDNVHAQNTTQLAETLLQLNRQFDLMLYPNRTHSIGDSEAQVHLFTLMTEWLGEHLKGE